MAKRGLIAAFLILLTGAVGITWQILSAPRTLRIAVGPFGSEDTRMVAAFTQGLAREQSNLRLRTVVTSGVVESARLVDDGKVDLAIIRPDIAMPTKADTILITRRFFPFFVAGADAGIERIADMRERKIGVVSPPEGNIKLLETILAHYEISPRPGMIVPLMATEIPGAVADGRIDTIFAVGAAGSRGGAAGMATLRNAFGTRPVFIPIREADAIAARYRTIETGEILRGSFGGDPPRPAEGLPTISVTHRLVASQALSDSVAGELTRELLNLRAVMAPEAPSVQGLEAPSTDKDAPLTVHRGTAAYLDGEVESFFDRYGDFFYIGVMGLSLLGSGFAALWSRHAGARRSEAMDGVTALMLMIDTARNADDQATLDLTLREADIVVAEAVAHMTRGDIDEAGIHTYRLVLDQIHRAVNQRRRELAQGAANAPGLVRAD